MDVMDFHTVVTHIRVLPLLSLAFSLSHTHTKHTNPPNAHTHAPHTRTATA